MTSTPVKPLLQLTKETLESPRAWGQWRLDQASNKVTHDDSIAELKQLTGDYAALRILQLYSVKGEPFGEDAHAYAKACLKSDNPVIRAFALVLLAADERVTRMATSTQTAHEIDTEPAISMIREQLDIIRASECKTDFALEVQAQILYDLSVLHREMGNEAESMKIASEGIYLSLPLGYTNLTSSLRMSYALSAMGSGKSQEALQKYLEVRNTPGANTRQRLYSTLNVVNLYVLSGDYPSALDIIRDAEQEYPGSPEVGVTRQFVEGLSALLPLDAAILPFPAQSRSTLNRALQIVSNSEMNPRACLYNDALALLKDIPESAAFFRIITRWLQVHCLFRTGKPFLAAQRLGDFDASYPILRLFLLALRIEMALHPDGYERDALGDLTRDLARSFEQLPNRCAAAKLLTLWYPTAAAFVAMSPYSVAELADEAMPGIFADGRPAQIYGQPVPAKLPFVQATLEAFGIPADVPRDMSSERERMRAALTTTWGSSERTLPVIAPALLIVNYIRLAEREGGLWINAARQLEKMHGLIPKTTGTHLREQRGTLHDALEGLITGEIDSRAFDRTLATLKNHARG
ncbi:hypothetical protein [Deinococcus enclensis]|uniref:Tetratricopeptide (TPR) repeat protein n=1 Tax=Deinococcus enclensis TaxID=1049582 RepID=A0ABT9MHS5_9DEIO|nr:hypothetical protein [Deinococcus enclensis]MDP9766147.1 tetratricopeptide (TPR) repeat protein [Deinococcus enclensis]